MVVAVLDSHEPAPVRNQLDLRRSSRAVVPTPDGPKHLIDVAIGDRVYSFDQSRGIVETTISQTTHSRADKVRMIRTCSRRVTVRDENYVLVVKVEKIPHPTRPWHTKRIGSLQWMRAEYVAVGDLVVCAEGYYSDQATVGRGRARLVGAMLGDGWVRHDTARRDYTVGLAIGCAGEHHTIRYRALLEAELPAANWSLDAKGTFGLTRSSVAVWRAMDALGVIGYSHEKRVPTWAFALALDEKRALLAGYLDADGSVSANPRNAGRGTIASTNPELVEQLRELAIACRFRITPISRESWQTNFGSAIVYRCVMSADAIRQLDLWHDRKSRNVRAGGRSQGSGLASGKIGYVQLPPSVFVQRVSTVRAGLIDDLVTDLTVEHRDRSFVCDGVVIRGN